MAMILHEKFMEVLGADLLDGKIDIDVVLDSALPGIIRDLRNELSKRSPEMLNEHRSLDAGFVGRNVKRWQEAFDVIEEHWVIVQETVEQFREYYLKKTVGVQDKKFSAIINLHARSLLVTREIICLLKGGFPDGALSRWRTLHEHAVISQFISKNDPLLAERYLVGFILLSIKSAKNYNKHASKMGLELISDKDISSLIDKENILVQKYGHEIKNNYGWAYPWINSRRPTFEQMEECVDMDHWRPYYAWASQHIHSNNRPIGDSLGLSESKSDIMLVGPSNSGFVDPFQLTVTTLNTVTNAVFSISPTIDTIVVEKIISEMAIYIGPLAARIEKQTYDVAMNNHK